MSSTIGKSLRAARERRGWTREALAYHAGVSWAAIAQIESGRRSDARLSTLSALARALGVSLDHLVGTEVGTPRPLLRHQALVYGSDEELLETAVPFLMEGLKRSECPMVVLTRSQIRLLRKALGDDAGRVEFAESARWYSSLAKAVSGYRAYLGESLDTGAVWVRIVAEPAWSGWSPEQLQQWKRYETVVNLSFAAAPVTFLCVHDTRTTPSAVIAEMGCTHPEIVSDGELVASSDYREPEGFLIGLSER